MPRQIVQLHARLGYTIILKHITLVRRIIIRALDSVLVDLGRPERPPLLPKLVEMRHAQSPQEIVLEMFGFELSEGTDGVHPCVGVSPKVNLCHRGQVEGFDVLVPIERGFLVQIVKGQELVRVQTISFQLSLTIGKRLFVNKLSQSRTTLQTVDLL